MFFARAVGEERKQQKKHIRHNCSKMQTTLVLAKPLAVAFRPTPAVEAKT